MIDMASIVDLRFSGIVDQIDYYAWVKHDTGKLSDEQKKHLEELQFLVGFFGERANEWWDLAQELLQ